MDSYVQAAFEELLREDGLAVFGQGLGVTRLLIKFLHYYSTVTTTAAPNNPLAAAASSSSSSSSGVAQQVASTLSPHRPLVLCINTAGTEDYILKALLADGLLPDQLPKVITNDQHTQERPDLYAMGGCFLVTSRILIVDLLDGKLDPRTVTGLLIPAAHKVPFDDPYC